MPIVPHLPPNANLEHLKKQARKLLQAFQAGDPEAFARIKNVLSRFSKIPGSDLPDAPLTLRECQQAIAREYGFTSWQKMSATINSDKRPKNNGLSDRFRSILELAREEAFRLNHTRVDSEHILLGLYKRKTGSGTFLLKKLGLGPEKITTLENQIKASPGPVSKDQTLFSPTLKTIFDIASDEADENDSPYIRTCHLILALAKDPNTTSHKLLKANGVEYQALKNFLHVIKKVPRKK